MKTLNPAYVAVGAVDFAAEKVTTLPGVKKLADIKVAEGAKNLDTLQASFAEVRTNVNEKLEKLATRGEKVVDRLEGRVETTRKTVMDIRDETVKTLENLRSEPAKQFGELRDRVSNVIRRPKAKKTTKKAA